LENAECGRRPRKAEIRPLGEPEVTRIKQKATPQSATPKKTERTEKRKRKEGDRDGKNKKPKKIATSNPEGVRQSRKKVK